MYLRFNVESQHLTRTDRSIVVARSENYLKAKFDFSPDWDGVTKTGVFTNGGRVYNVILDNDECFVPTEVIRKGCFTVSVFGGDLITADVVTIRVEPSGYEIGGSPEPPTPGVYEQVLGMFDKFRGGEEGQVLSKSSDEDLEFEWIDQGGGGGGTAPRWGNITGILSNQADLQAALDEKENAADAFDGNYNNLTNKPELFSGDYNDLTNKPSLFSGNYNDLTDKPSIPDAVVANPTLDGTEATLTGLKIGDDKFKIPTGGGGSADWGEIEGDITEQTDLANALNAKLNKDIAQFGGGGANLFVLADSHYNWQPGHSSGSNYSDGSTVNKYYTTNLFPYESNQKIKVNIGAYPNYLRFAVYDAEGNYLSAIGSGTLDTDGYIYFQTVKSNAAYACIYANWSVGVFENLYIADYDTFGDTKVAITDLYFTDKNVAMAKHRLGIADDVLFGKKWAITGDSFTEGNFTGSSEPHVLTEGIYMGENAVYPYLIGNRHRMIIQKLFKGGRTLAHPSDDSFTNTFSDVYQNIDADADYLTIYLGINDSHHRPGHTGDDGESTTGEITLGTITDSTTATFYGAWNVILSWLVTNRPNLKIGIIVSNGCETDDYRTATIAIAQKYGIPYIDLNGDERTPCMIRSTNANIDADIRAQRTTNWRVTSSNLHPNVACHEYEATIIEAFLKTL